MFAIERIITAFITIAVQVVAAMGIGEALPTLVAVLIAKGSLFSAGVFASAA